MDPTGHINNDPSELDAANAAIDILTEHGITVEVDWGWVDGIWNPGSWTISELAKVVAGVEDLAAKIGAELNNGLSNAENFRNVVGPVTMRRVRKCRDDAAALTLLNTITLYDGAFYYDTGGATSPEWSKECVVHELGHAWDWNAGKMPSMFIAWETGAWQRPTEYAEANFSEHWADTVAVWVYPNAADAGRSLGPRHKEYITNVVTASPDWWFPLYLAPAAWAGSFVMDRMCLWE